MLDLDYHHARKLLLTTDVQIVISLVGCGGTGSWLAPAVVRVAKKLLDENKDVQVYFIDPDFVEKKNVYRQNFCEAEIGLNKAITLANRYGLAWGVPVRAVAKAFQPGIFNRTPYTLMLLIGCVDNASARGVIHGFINEKHGRYKSMWWLDCGNEESAGQVLLGCGGKLEKDDLKLPGFCGWLPGPGVQHPDLLDVQFKDLESLSCADMAMQDSQGMAINQRIAAEAADYLVRMLITKDLRKMATYLDLESGSTRSKYITDENLGVSVSTETVEELH